MNQGVEEGVVSAECITGEDGKIDWWRDEVEGGGKCRQ